MFPHKWTGTVTIKDHAEARSFPGHHVCHLSLTAKAIQEVLAVGIDTCSLGKRM